MPETGVVRSELISYLDELLDSRSFTDFGPNGLQVEGRDPIRKLVTGVSACLELFERAGELGADTVLVHHGLFWKGLPYELTGVRFQRVESLIRSRMNLIGYHLPLDAHAEFGNNALGARRLGCRQLEPFGEWEGRKIGFKGRFPESLDPDQLEARCREVFGKEPLIFRGGPERIETLGIVSGGGAKAVWDAIDEGLDVYVTGEPNEWVMNVAMESGVHFVAAGHYHSEVLGVQALGEHLVEKFGLDVEFVDVPNPI
ncbi:MAG: Nif3-like dinuclear metal center hexameric protein [Thermoanaerobaculia bacterium]